jgi:hypothetical protein
MSLPETINLVAGFKTKQPPQIGLMETPQPVLFRQEIWTLSSMPLTLPNSDTCRTFADRPFISLILQSDALSPRRDHAFQGVPSNRERETSVFSRLLKSLSQGMAPRHKGVLVVGQGHALPKGHRCPT